MVNENSKKNKHLTPEDRREIKECLSKRMTFKAIGKLISYAEIARQTSFHVHQDQRGHYT